MKNIRTLIAVFVILVVTACSSTMQYTWQNDNYQGRTYEKILVVVEANSQSSRINAENVMVDRLQSEGINATNSLPVFKPGERIEELSEDEIENRILSGGYDGVLISLLVDANSREVREGGGTYMQPVTYRYGRRIRTGYVHLQEPEYYRKETTFVLETQLYDTKDKATKQNVVWSGQSELTDPSSLDSAVKSYSKKLVKTLIESGIVKP
ncbi:hypothetical protein [uncultured Draconibacterium sp.]|uniref:hypothetical protein n=1 Tax=uncultured Draconibacterium sp. TaxID=1573823 RepID=UPI002AA90E40|nr:hypothetical protein [uncultured Draconibacterium sp.]